MNISSLMKKYIDECEEHSRSRARLDIPRVLRENRDLPLEPVQNSWSVAQGPERLIRKYSFDSLQQRTLFLEYLLENEEKNQHFARITIEGLDVTVEVWTHDIERVTELDQEYAGNCDGIYNDVMLVRFTDYE